MPNYVFNVVYRGKAQGVAQKMEPQFFPGSAQEFAQDQLLAWMADHGENENWFVVVNVWDADQEGVGDPSNIICQLTNHDLDKGPFDPDQIFVEYAQYYLYSAGYNLFTDPVLAPGGTASLFGTSFGLAVPGAGPAVAVWTGHEGCWISLRVARLAAEPAAELDEWEAVEQVTIQPTAEVVLRGALVGKTEEHYPDLRGDHDGSYLSIRVSARGRDSQPGVPASPQHPRRNPVEHHLIQTWPAAEPALGVVLKRDDVSRRDR